ncbi:protein phosphatase 1, regulatory subunit 10 [Rattus norvegicus]|uniref:Serine/threonine-protein phosphatase 1 regulatory subunit 10 n=3 Tax=Rattus norvegicus TaxID=10116 RepID=PP1RA_RAT|nr:serine/threonine-protein phosphatase 1 regulatory subunit 10 [Rattus norvegicus]XP_038954982.1 serine/threonine-protein phosphatase 1 regulatory subunit 10 isoform X1 [Rattus norvegicus]XP_038954983.1 serine/threonine-protein phosphatase 1 regulatory subunit 10 isoform X1 [Rattus norvegicus]O55000.1 RecName: Full=Serine/threonine-protein phosphatase 1 regulatory subunit 10; AltName: Full=MHC class I region proline-rich protein CAT53; AltName: Full=Phosphatase 1 nuclear targeting subunit; Shor|eukprot:NP_075240.1 serine/threonine-protein phosphatase 1 regulatory subunit 10 [Rattus norvegicus]
MGSGPIDPKELLKGLDSFLTRDGEVKSVDGIAKIFSLMKEARKMVSRCTYLNIILQTRAPEVLVKFIDVGGYKLLNSWLTYSKTTNNIPLLQQILLTLQHLPLTVDHLKQNNTAKLVKQLSKSSEDEELRKLASVLVSDWMAVIRSQSSTQPAEKDKKKRKEEGKSRTTLPERPLTEVKAETRAEEAPEKKKEKPKSLRTTAPSHAKFRSTGLELDTPSLVPVKKNSSTVVVSDKYNLKPIPLKRQSATAAPGDAAPPAEKKYKPLNTTPNTTKEIKVKIIPPQPMEGLGFLDALNSAPVPGIKIKKKKKVLSPTAAKPSPFEGKTSTEPSTAKPSSPEPAAPAEPMDTDRPGTPVPAVEVPELMDAASSEPGALDAKPVESPGDPNQLTRKGRKRKTVTWPEEGKLREYFYFELDETERVNVNKIKDFGEAAKREILSDRHAFETARRLSHDNMEEKVPWVCPRPLVLPSPLVIPGSNSQERYIQAEREKGILQELFLNKESPHEPDPEPYEPIPPKLIPLDEECAMDETPYVETLEPGGSGGSPDGAGGSKLPPVLANLMGSMGAGKSPQGPGGGGINVQEILTSIMGSPNNHPSEELLKQPDYSDKLKQMLVPHGLLGPGPVANGFPPGGPGGPKGMQHFPPGPGGPMPGPHGGPGGPVGPRLLGPPPPSRGGDPFWDGPGDPMRGGPMRGGPGPGPGPYHRGRGGRGGNEPPPPPPFRGARGGRSGGGPPNGRGGPGGGGMVGGGGHRPHEGPGGSMGSGHRSHEGPGGSMGSGHRSHEGPGHGGPHGHRPHDVPSHRGHDHRGPPPHEHRGHDGHGGGGHRGHDGGHSHGGDMSNRPVCRHFMMKGNCRYENNCAFYHPGVNGPPLP